MTKSASEYICCPNCGADDSFVWAREAGFSAVKCKLCGLVYVNPRPSADVVSEANRLGVHQTDEGKLDVTGRYRGSKVRFYSRLLAKLFAEEIDRGSPLQWLDVGAGYGELTQAAHHVLPASSSVRGIEPMSPKVAAAKSRGLNVEDISLSAVDGHFDVISLINVFSHIPDFKSFLMLIRERLVPGGTVLIETGNAADLETRADYPGPLDLPDHLVFTGIEQMRSLLEGSGFVFDTHRAQRIDTAVWAAQETLKSFLAGRPAVTLPYRFAFRTVFYRARRAD